MTAAPPVLDRTDGLTMAAVAAIGIATVLIDPIGYIGGRWDDGRYLEAALRWAGGGPSLGREHWSLRWPVVLPAAAAIRLFGLNRAALMVPGLAMFTALLATIYAGVRTIWRDRTAATLAALSATTALAIASAATRLTADLPEALAWTWALWFLALAGQRSNRAQIPWMVASGLACGLAWEIRETAVGLGLVMAAAFGLGWGPPRLRWAWLAAGALMVVLPGQLLLWRASGDWLYRLHTDLRHIDIASTHLAGPAAPGTRAALNPAMAARWDGAGPIHLWWAADPWINLLLNAQYGLVFAGCAVLAALDRRWRRDRTFTALAFIVAANVVTVVYIVATDPKPRMFLPAVVAGSVALGLLGVRAWRRGQRWTVVAIAFAKLLVFMVALNAATRFDEIPAMATRVLAAAPGPVAAGRWTRSHLALSQVLATRDGGESAQLALTLGKPNELDLPPGLWRPLSSVAATPPLAVRAAIRLGLPVKANDPAATLWRCVARCAPLQGPPSVDVGQ